MSTYQELCDAFTESYKRQNEYSNDCCDFANFVFKKMAEHSEWPQDRITFSRDKQPEVCSPTCNRTVASLRKDGYLCFDVCLEIRRNDNPAHRYKITIPTTVKKFGESFFVKIEDMEDEFLLNENDTDELQKFFEFIFGTIKRHFSTPFLDWDVPGLLREIDPEDEDNKEE